MPKRRGRQRSRPFFIFVLKSRILAPALLAVFCIGVFLWRGQVNPAGVSGPLAGQIVYIDPGHGGIDPGACGRKYLEKDIVLKVSLLLGVRLEKSGARVVYTRTGDWDLETEEVDDLTARVNLMKSSKATIVVSIHCNAFTSSYERGAQTFYNASRHPASKKLASLIQEELVKETETDREISARLDHFILNHSTVPAVTVELGFLSNPSEEELLGNSSYQEKLAGCLYRAIVSFVTSETN